MKEVQNTFRNQLNAVCSTIEEMGNSFADQTGDLFVLDTRSRHPDSKVVETVRTVEQLGKDQYQQFVTKTGCMIVFLLRYLGMGSSDLVPNRICYRVSRRMDQRKHKGHLFKLCRQLDGAAIVNMLKPEASKTFQEYSKTVFLPYVVNQLRNV